MLAKDLAEQRVRVVGQAGGTSDRDRSGRRLGHENCNVTGSLSNAGRNGLQPRRIPTRQRRSNELHRTEFDCCFSKRIRFLHRNSLLKIANLPPQFLRIHLQTFDRTRQLVRQH
jgi:hypothetical protein